MTRTYYIYIVTNKPLGVLYTGITGNIIERILQHKNRSTKGFTHKYNLDKLVYFECCDIAYDAINREKYIKNRGRQWKINLIESTNPAWRDLWEDIYRL